MAEKRKRLPDISSAGTRHSTQSSLLSQPTFCGMHAVYVDLTWANTFSEREQWAELYNDEELRLVSEETMSPE